jgi:hypothetical protein
MVYLDSEGRQVKQRVLRTIRKDVGMMAKRIILILALAALLGATATEAVTFERGKKGRRYFRHSYYVENLQNDKLAVYEEYGFPVHRLREYGYGRITERWTYRELGLEFTFDESSNLIDTRSFRPENRRERFERFPGY